MIALDRLIDLALGADDDAADEHVLACGACASLLERLLAIGDGVRALVAAGKISTIASGELVDAMIAAKLLTRHHVIAAGAIVPCRITADDLFSATHLLGSFEGIARVDVIRTTPAGRDRIADVPVDRVRNEVHLITSATAIRPLPSMHLRFELVAVSDDGERTIGTYTLDHTAT
jgi:hypothetical protein